VASLRVVLPHNEHLKSDFSMQHCVMQNYEEQVSARGVPPPVGGGQGGGGDVRIMRSR
jgi:hypothetical protein